MVGVRAEVSGKTSSRLQGAGSTNSRPRWAATNWLQEPTSASSLQGERRGRVAGVGAEVRVGAEVAGRGQPQ
jgi:hypothetical protein